MNWWKKVSCFAIIILCLGCAGNQGKQDHHHQDSQMIKDTSSRSSSISLDTYVDQATSYLQDKISDKSLPIVVSGLRDHEGHINGFTEWLSDALSTSLAGKQVGQVIDRARIDALVAEQKISFDDLYDPEKAIELGRLLSARLIVTGTVMPFSDYYWINLRVTRCLDGIVVDGSGFSAKIIKTIETEKLWDMQTDLLIKIVRPTVPYKVYVDGILIGTVSNSMPAIRHSGVTSGLHNLKLEPKQGLPESYEFNQPKYKSIKLILNPGIDGGKPHEEKIKFSDSYSPCRQLRIKDYQLFKGTFANCLSELARLNYANAQTDCDWHMATEDEYRALFACGQYPVKSNKSYWMGGTSTCVNYHASTLKIADGITCRQKNEINRVIFICD